MGIYRVGDEEGSEMSTRETDSPEQVNFNFNPRHPYNVDNFSAPSSADALPTGIGVNFEEGVIWAKHPITGELVSIGMTEEQVRDFFQIKNAVTTDTIIESDVYVPAMKRIKAAALGSIVQQDDELLVANVAHAKVIDVEDDDTVVVMSDDDVPEGELGRQNTRRLNKPGDTLKAYDQSSYLPVATPEDEKPFVFDPTAYAGFGIPLPNGIDASPDVMSGNIGTVEEALSHLFGLTGNGLSILIDAGIKVGLPVRHGMTLKEYVEVIESIAGVSVTVKGFTYITQKSHYTFRRNAVTSADVYLRPARVTIAKQTTGHGRRTSSKHEVTGTVSFT